jgi:hypothetical protein
LTVAQRFSAGIGINDIFFAPFAGIEPTRFRASYMPAMRSRYASLLFTVGVRAVSAFALAPLRFALCVGVAHGY